MYHKINLYLEHLLRHFQVSLLPCRAVLLHNSLNRNPIPGLRLENKAFKDAYRLRKATSLGIAGLFLLGMGQFTLFGQSAKAPDIRVDVSGKLTCVNTSVRLKGSSKTLGVYYSWTGPGGYVSTAQEPVTAMPGEYTLTVKDPVDGGTATAKVKVVVDTLAPAGVKATVSGLLTCKDTSVTMTGISSTPDVSFGWQGPKNFAVTKKSAATATPGIYLLTITNPANGCATKTNVRIGQNIVPPAGVTANASGMLTCHVNNVTLTGASATKDVRFRWSGPDFNSESDKPNVSSPGNYMLEVTDPSNGCSAGASVTVAQDAALPAQVKAAASDSLTCKNAKATLSASSSTKGVTYKWTGPNGFVSTDQSAETNMPGNFAVMVYNPATGCSVSKQVTVVKDTMPPAGVSATVSGILSCKEKTVVLKAATSSPKVTYIWKGPANFSSTQAVSQISVPGMYEVTVAGIANGCIKSSFVKVTQDTITPQGVTASVSGSLSCKTPSISLDGTSVSKQVVLSWEGPQGFKAIGKKPAVKVPGRYMLSATNPENGCVSNTTVIVTGTACDEKKQ